MKFKSVIVFLTVVGLLVLWRQLHLPASKTLVHNTGLTMGSITYNIKYLATGEQNYQNQVDSILIAFNQSLSTYIPQSQISRLNDTSNFVFTDGLLPEVLRMSQTVYHHSHGAFDPTIGTLVNAYGFGVNKEERISAEEIESLMPLIGFEKISFDRQSLQKPKEVCLDFSAIAKGMAVDEIARFLTQKDIKNFMIEIGGEVTCKGKNQYDLFWKIGIEKPNIERGQQSVFSTVFLKNMSMATSGNYRNYYMKDGKMVAHTISPFTGESISHNLLSASIFAPNCAMSDGYATACMVMGLEKSIEMVEKTDSISAFFIYSDNNGELNYYVSTQLKSSIEVL